MVGPFGALARHAATQPIDSAVSADDARFLLRKGTAKLAFRVLKRRLEIVASGQARHERSRIEPAWKRALWIHAEAPQIGDALMDLAPRSLLAERGIALDLLAPPQLCTLFAGDRLFGRVFADDAGLDASRYDVVVVDSRSWKALAAKRRHAPALPWVSIKGDYLGYDYHRGLFATRRLAELLGAPLDAASEHRHARQKLVVREASVETATTPAGLQAAPHCALALGGVRRERSYAHWPEVAARLVAGGVRRFTLLGSANAEADRDAVVARLASMPGDAVATDDLVGRSDLHGSRRAMRAADVLLCADGGLMHLGLTTAVPVVALFDASVDPAWRLPADFTGTALRSPTCAVSAIEPAAVARAALACPGLAEPSPALQR